ncbi:hypothetical protein AV656_11180 [Bhargavaea cecembensis]|uniref:DUF4352 domain-containing protein n=1 Tax=Bhargavaea cecembensis TaxID=394098 RepID=A0A161RGN2_9BACL|nr:hypothetical protein [Bhargavaea cecembensis]KZE37138.1 hypothetical protein AV656_11180 [Bhargavaea cecembensis]
MKRATLMIGLTTLMLTGCSWEMVETERIQNVHKAEAATLPATEYVPPYYKGYPLNPQVTDDRLLLQPGGTVLDERGEAELLRIGNRDKRITAGPAQVTVREAKLFHYYPDSSFTDFYHLYTEETDFPVAKLFVEVTNTGNVPIQFEPVAVLETDTGESKLWKDDIYLENLAGNLGPGETKKGSVGFILEDDAADRLIIRTSEVFDGNGKTLSGGSEVEVLLDEGK